MHEIWICNKGHYHQHVCEISKQTMDFTRSYGTTHLILL